MAQHDRKPCERRASILEDGPRKDSWQDDGLIGNYHALGPLAISAATLYAGERDQPHTKPKKKR